MNNYVIKKMTKAIIDNIDKYATTEITYSESDNKYVLSGSSLFKGISFPSAEMVEKVIESFNYSKFAEDNNIEITFRETFDGKKHLFAWFK